MEQFGFLRDLLMAFMAAGVVVFLFQRLRLPAVGGAGGGDTDRPVRSRQVDVPEMELSW